MGSETIPACIPAPPGDIAADAMAPMLEMVLGSRMTFADRLDPAVLARATRLLLDLEPVLGCWWDESFRGAEWVRCTDLDERSAFSLVETDDADRDAAAFHATSFDPKGPRLAVLLLRGPEHDDACVRFDHGAGDGWSAVEVTQLLAETYTRVLDDPGYAPVPRTADRPTHADVWKALSDEQRAAAAEPVKALNTSQWKMHTKRGPGDGFFARTLTLPAERVAAIRAYTHARGGTVNDALVAALLRAAEAMHPQKAGTAAGVSISADTRRMACDPGLDRVANIATTQTVLFDFHRGETFEETLRHVSERVRPFKDCLWTIGATLTGAPPSPAVWHAIFAFLTAMIRVTHAAALVTMNLGPFDEERLVFGGARPVSAHATGPIARFAGFPLLISYYRDTLTIWTGVRERIVAPEFADRYLAGIEGELAGIES